MNAKEASDIIEKAIQEAIMGMGYYHPDDMLVEWALICYVANPDDPGKSCYPEFYSDGSIAHHKAIGLHNVALKHLHDEEPTE